MSSVSWPTGPKLVEKLKAVGKITFDQIRPLLEEFERILVEGNRNRVLRGMQSNDTPMPPVTYRTGISGKPTGRRGKNYGVTKYAPKGRGHRGIAIGNPRANGNLTTAEYKKLTGPPLAPRGERSRVIANLETSIGEANGKFYAAKSWRDVLDCHGRPFLMAHFTGARVGRGRKVKLPVRDLRGVGKFEKDEAKKAVAKWARWHVKQAGL